MTFKKKLENLQVDGMGFGLWFMKGWWNPLTRPFYISEAKKFLMRCRGKRADVVNFFCMCLTRGAGNRHWLKFSPWKKTKAVYGGYKKFKLHERNEKYFNGYRALMKLFAETGDIEKGEAGKPLDPLKCFWLARYMELPFEHNVNDVHGIMTPAGEVDKKALRYMTPVVNELIEIEAEEYKKAGWSKHKQRARIFNEPPCKANHKALHFWADMHRAVYEKTDLRINVAPEQLLFDAGGCDAVFWWFVHRHQCPKRILKNGAWVQCPVHKGSDKYLDHGKRRVQPMNHGYSIPSDLEDNNFDHAIGSAWGTFVMGEDGGARRKEDANGHRLYSKTGKLLWAVGDKDQSGDMFREALREGKKKGKKIIFQMIFLSSLSMKGNKLMEDFRMSSLSSAEWDKLDRLKNVVRNVTGID